MDIASFIAIALTFLFAFVASWALIIPYFEESEEESVDSEGLQREDLLARREALLSALEELEVDFLSKKILEADYRRMKDELSAEAVACLQTLKQIDQEQQTANTNEPSGSWTAKAANS